MTIHFGRKILRERPLKNSTLSEESQHYEGEFVLFIQNCAWRIEHAGEVAGTSKSRNTEGGEMLRALMLLKDATVVSTSISTPGRDVTVEFSTGATLRTFCDCASEDTDGANYTLLFPGGWHSVGEKGKITRDDRPA